MTIQPEQEEGLRKAARNIDLLAKQYEQNYAVRDKQDVLAMCALQFSSMALKLEDSDTEMYSEAAGRIELIIDRIRKGLKE